MTPEELRNAAKVMNAAADGAIIEMRRRCHGAAGIWEKWRTPPYAWNWYEWEYRTKPEPREWDMWLSPEGDFGPYHRVSSGSTGERIKVREVLKHD